MKILKKTKAFVCTVAILMLASTNYSFARHSQHSNGKNSTFEAISSSVRVRAGSTKTIQLNNTTYIKKLIISAQGTPSSDATMQVVVNGDIKGTIHVPRHDPSYFVTVNEKTTSIQFVSLQGAINISSIKVVGSQHSQASSKPWKTGINYSRGLYGHNRGTLAQEVALSAIDLVTEFSKYSSYKQLGNILLPIKKSAARVYAVSYGAGDYSIKMRTSLINLANQLNMATQFINENFEKTALFDLALELLSLKEQLDFIIK